MRKIKTNGFSLIETLVVIAIVGILSTIVLVALFTVKNKANDTKRKAEITQIGRFLTGSCYLPEGGEGEYDLKVLIGEVLSVHPEYGEYVRVVPKDPKTGNDTESKYIYTVNDDGSKCAVYANLENDKEPVTLSITAPTPGGGVGVFRANDNGWNGTPLYFQYSN